MMQIKRRNLYFILDESGVPRRLSGAPDSLSPLKNGFSRYLQLSDGEEYAEVSPFMAGSLKDAIQKPGIIGQPMGSNNLGVVYRVVVIEE